MCCMLMNIKCLFKYKKWQNTLREIVDFMENPAFGQFEEAPPSRHPSVYCLDWQKLSEQKPLSELFRSEEQDKYELITKWKWFV